MSENQEDPKNAMPTERKSMWRTAEERRMSDLTRVLEWLERRRGKKKQILQKQKPKTEVAPKATEKEVKKSKITTGQKATRQTSSKNEEPVYRKIYVQEQMGKRLSIASSIYSREGPRKSDLDIKDAIALESTQRQSTFRRQSSSLDPVLQDSVFSSRRSTLVRDWGSKTPDSNYERKLKSLLDKGSEPKVEALKMLKPDEVLSCRYLRLSKNNIRTLLKLCKDAGLNVDIHPHMVEAEIDSKKVFAQVSNAAP